ncbi:enoyl-CoA hydratase [Nocardiopsis sp. TSRI0078]|uniref:enoyl-CoA-hydratase DpgB n=1 Tax=unclassified Nocardiopsis TaxID=2649073 RepID=UPI00093F00E5|nr:enoyl-CoA-hydratase DpgB [Nocardiopsis sp. TSRI0078]OKI23647.1 enoyl-CoA hydratase [Nocardiopsis sp. TSRI0078]
MRNEHDIEWDTVFTADIDGNRPIGELAASVNDLCGRVEGRPGSVILLRLAEGTPDRRSWPGAVDVRDVSRWEKAIRRLERSEAVSIVVGQGTCCGPALDVLLVGDYRIASADMTLLLPVNDDQFWPGMALHRLVREIGVARARQLVLWGDRLTAAAALENSLVNEVSTDVEDTVRSAVVFLRRTSGTDLAVRRQLLFEAASNDFEDSLGVHLAACDRELRRLRAQPRSGVDARVEARR